MGSELQFWVNPWRTNEQNVLTRQFAHGTGNTKKMKKATGEGGGEEVISIETRGVTFKDN